MAEQQEKDNVNNRGWQLPIKIFETFIFWMSYILNAIIIAVVIFDFIIIKCISPEGLSDWLLLSENTIRAINYSALMFWFNTPNVIEHTGSVSSWIGIIFLVGSLLISITISPGDRKGRKLFFYYIAALLCIIYLFFFSKSILSAILPDYITKLNKENYNASNMYLGLSKIYFSVLIFYFVFLLSCCFSAAVIIIVKNKMKSRMSILIKAIKDLLILICFTLVLNCSYANAATISVNELADLDATFLYQDTPSIKLSYNCTKTNNCIKIFAQPDETFLEPNIVTLHFKYNFAGSVAKEATPHIYSYDKEAEVKLSPIDMRNSDEINIDHIINDYMACFYLDDNYLNKIPDAIQIERLKQKMFTRYFLTMEYVLQQIAKNYCSDVHADKIKLLYFIYLDTTYVFNRSLNIPPNRVIIFGDYIEQCINNFTTMHDMSKNLVFNKNFHIAAATLNEFFTKATVRQHRGNAYIFIPGYISLLTSDALKLKAAWQYISILLNTPRQYAVVLNNYKNAVSACAVKLGLNSEDFCMHILGGVNYEQFVELIPSVDSMFAP